MQTWLYHLPGFDPSVVLLCEYKNSPYCFFMYAHFSGQLIFSLFLILVYLDVSLRCSHNKPHTVAQLYLHDS